MILVAVVQAVATPEWWQVALPYAAALVSGAVGGGVISLIGAKLQFNRDHARWLKEERLENYAEIVRLIVQLEAIGLRARSVKSRLEALSEPIDKAALDKLRAEGDKDSALMVIILDEVSRATARGYLITGTGTDAAISNHASLVSEAPESTSEASIVASRRRMINAMRKDLNVT